MKVFGMRRGMGVDGEDGHSQAVVESGIGKHEEVLDYAGDTLFFSSPFPPL